MPIHDWTRVDAGIYHAFHQTWIVQISRALNGGLLPADYYALPEQQTGSFGPDILTLQCSRPDDDEQEKPTSNGSTGVLLAPPRVRFTVENALEFYRRKKNVVVVRHVSRDQMIAVLEIVSPGNKASRKAFAALMGKACELLDHNIHLLILDLFPPTKRDPQGFHSALWEELTGETFTPPSDKPLTLAAYESGLTVKAFIEPVAVGDSLPDMPLFLEPGAHILVPLETTYQEAFEAVPLRWRRVL